MFFPSNITMSRELHIYDFDGTLVRSPVIHPDNNAELVMYAQQPCMYGGLGWFGNFRSLRPPCVPYRPKVTDEFYIISTIESFRKSMYDGHFVVVLTGRHEPFRQRVEDLLRNAHLEPHEVILKPNVKSSTVAAKSEAIFQLIQKVHPSAVRMWDDREEQARKILAAVESLIEQNERNQKEEQGQGVASQIDFSHNVEGEEESSTAQPQKNQDSATSDVSSAHTFNSAERDQELLQKKQQLIKLPLTLTVVDEQPKYLSIEDENDFLWKLYEDKMCGKNPRR